MGHLVRDRLVVETDAAIETAWTGSRLAWGLSDCALAIADIYRAALDVDPAAAFRGRYRTERGAKRILGPGGLVKAVGLACRRLGWQRIDPKDASPGDLGMILTPQGPACVIRHRLFFVGRIDFGFATHSEAIRAWCVA